MIEIEEGNTKWEYHHKTKNSVPDISYKKGKHKRRRSKSLFETLKRKHEEKRKRRKKKRRRNSCFGSFHCSGMMSLLRKISKDNPKIKDLREFKEKIDINTEEQERFCQEIADCTEFFGKPLQKVKDVPIIVFDIMNFLSSEKSQATHEIGIFESDGNKELLDEVVETLEMGEQFPLDDILEHFPEKKDKNLSLFSLIKSYFTRMKEPLVNCKLMDDWINLANRFRKRQSQENQKIEAIKTIMNKFSPAHLSLFKYLFLMLNKIQENSKINKITLKKLAEMTHSFIIRKKKKEENQIEENRESSMKDLIAFMITHAKQL